MLVLFPFAFVSSSSFDPSLSLSLFYLFRSENSTMIREHEEKWRFQIFSKRWREGGRDLNIDRNREEALIARLDRNRISKGVENARVYVKRRSQGGSFESN